MTASAVLQPLPSVELGALPAVRTDARFVPINFYLPQPHTKVVTKKPVDGLFYKLVYPFLWRIYLLGLNILFGILALLLQVTLVSLKTFQSLRRPQFPRKRVVIVGGGYAGTSAAMSLEREFDTTLIDMKDYFEFTPSRLRTMVEPKHSKVIQVKHSKFLHHTTILEDKVDLVATEFVKTASNNIVEYDYLVICAGSRTRDVTFPSFSELAQHGPNAPGVRDGAALHRHGGYADVINANPGVHLSSSPTMPAPVLASSPLPPKPSQPGPAVILTARAEHFHQFYDVVARAKRVLIVGGGTVGVELAAEILEHFKAKELFLVHCRPQLLDRSSLLARRHAESFFVNNGVTLLLNDRLVGHEGTLWKTKNGIFVEADLCLVCTGQQPNSEMLMNATFHQYVNESNGLVKVNEHLQLQDHPNVFVAGDLTDIPEEEEKLCQTAGHEINVVISNIRRRERHQELIKYTPSACPMVVSLGKYDGIFTYRGWTLIGLIPAAMKEFIEWKELVFYWDWSKWAPGGVFDRDPYDARASIV